MFCGSEGGTGREGKRMRGARKQGGGGRNREEEGGELGGGGEEGAAGGDGASRSPPSAPHPPFFLPPLSPEKFDPSAARGRLKANPTPRRARPLARSTSLISNAPIAWGRESKGKAGGRARKKGAAALSCSLVEREGAVQRTLSLSLWWVVERATPFARNTRTRWRTKRGNSPASAAAATIAKRVRDILSVVSPAGSSGARRIEGGAGEGGDR